MQGQAQDQLQLVVEVEILIRGLSAAASTAHSVDLLQLAVLQPPAAAAAEVSPTMTAAALGPLLPLHLRLHQCSRNPLLSQHRHRQRHHRQPPPHHLAVLRSTHLALGQRQLRRLPLLHLRPRRQLRRHALLRRLRLHLVHLPAVLLWVPRQLPGGGAQLRHQHQQRLPAAQAIPLALHLQQQQLQLHQLLARVEAARRAVAVVDLTASEVLSAALAAPTAAVVAVIHLEHQRLHLHLQRREGLRRLLIRLVAAVASAAQPLAVATHSGAVAAAAIPGAPVAVHQHRHLQLALALLLLSLLLLAMRLVLTMPLLRCRRRCRLAPAIARCLLSQQRPQIPPIRLAVCEFRCLSFAIATPAEPHSGLN